MTNQTRMPALFLGHGSPMNAITDNAYAERWRALGEAMPRPRAVLCISAHWYTRGIGLTAMEKPPTIHDFYGFPPELHAFEYPAPGDPGLAERVAELLDPVQPVLTDEWGLDHGAWSLLAHLFPEADVPVVQLSIDGTRPTRFHYELGARLAPLRDEGVLILGSGNTIHALRDRGGEIGEDGIYLWAASFETRLRQCVLSGDHEPLLDYESWGEPAEKAVPTPDHYLPLLYVLALASEDDRVSFPVEGLERHGSISMLGVRVEAT